MFLSDFSIKRPVAMTCLIIMLVALGLNSYRKIGLELMPKFDIPYITVVTVYPGAAPADLEVDVARRIEDAVSSIDGLKHVTSVCMENVVQTVIEFELGVDVDRAASDAREKIDRELAKFPQGVEKPFIVKLNINAKPVITLTLSGNRTLEELYDYAENRLRDKLSAIRGVASAEIIGGSKREVQVLLDREKLASAGLTSLQVVRAIQGGVLALPAGRIREKGEEFSVRFDSEYHTVEEIASLQVAGRDGARRYLRDLGKVVMGAEERRQAVFLDGRQCLAIKIVKRADANTVEVVDNVRKAVEKISKELPDGMELAVFNDQGGFIRSTIKSTNSDIIQGIILTALLLFIFLANVRSTLIVSVTMPLTVVISYFFIYCAGLTFSIPSLLALGLSIGILVTNSIVVMESIVRKFQECGDSWEAARKGTADVAIAILASAGTNMVVLIPIGLMSSLVGFIFRPFAWTMLAVNVVSVFISFTLTPIMCALFLRKRSVEEKSFLENMSNKLLNRFVSSYTGLIEFILESKIAQLVITGTTVIIFIHALFTGSKLGNSFVPDMDRGQVMLSLEFPTRQSLDETIRRVLEILERIKDTPGLKHTLVTAGKIESVLGASSEGVYLGQVILEFCNKKERKESIHELMEMLRAKLADYPDCLASVNIADIGGAKRIPFEMEIMGEDLSKLEEIAREVRKIARSIDGFLDVDTTVRPAKEQLLVLPKRTVLSDSMMAPAELGMLLRANLEGMVAASFKKDGCSYDIRVKLEEKEGKDQVEAFHIPAGPGRPVPLSAFAKVEQTRQIIQITRSDKRRVTKVMANLKPTLPVGTAVRIIDREIAKRKILPPGYSVRYRGDYEIMDDAVRDFTEAGILATMLTYLTLAAIMESFARPLLIMLTLPFGLTGMIYALSMIGSSISILVMLGGVMLIGIVVNNAILILDRVRSNREKGMSAKKALIEGLRGETRPVVMITLAAILGMLPLALATGEGSELRNEIGAASVGGIIVSATLTLFIIPVLYKLTAREDKLKCGE